MLEENYSTRQAIHEMGCTGLEELALNRIG